MCHLQAILEKMKTHKDRLSPEDEGANYKMWAACDLATGLLISKTTNYELKEYPRVNKSNDSPDADSADDN